MGYIMKQYAPIIVAALLLTLCFSVNSVSSNSIEMLSDYDFYVDDDYDASNPGWSVDHFNVIQNAIDNASDGDSIFVYEGTYNEHFTIYKEISLIGENNKNTIICGNQNCTVINIRNRNVSIQGFTVKDSGNLNYDDILDHYTRESYPTGIKVNSWNCQIIGNIVINNGIGIYLGGYEWGANDNLIKNNHIKENDLGLYLLSRAPWDTSYGNDIIENNFINNEKDALGKGLMGGFIVKFIYKTYYKIKYPGYNVDYGFNNFNKNYWNRPRISPKLIPDYGFESIFFFDLDLRPSLLKYNI